MFSKTHQKALHFIDPADIEIRRKEFYDLLSTMSDIIDILSLNENECNSLAYAGRLRYPHTIKQL